MNNLVSERVKKSFGRKEVLNCLSFTAKPGEVTFLAGPNGAGKTTWLRVATGLAHPTAGKVIFGQSSIEKVREKVAASFDEPAVYPHLNGKENLMVISGVLNLQAPEKKALIDFLELGSLLHRKAGVYSYGQKKRLLICAAFLRNPTYLLLDEPTIGLDPDVWNMVKEILKDFTRKGAVVFLTGQNLDAMEPLVDHAVVLNKGVAVFEGTITELQNRRPPKVKVKTHQPEILVEHFQGFQLANERAGILEKKCQSLQEAERIMNNIRNSNLSIQGVEIDLDTLEEAYRAIIKETTEGIS